MTTIPLPMTEGQKARLIKALEGNWQEETEGAATYRVLAERESDSSRRQILMEMAESETAHAKRWAQRLGELGSPEPVYKGDTNGRADSFANRVGGALSMGSGAYLASKSEREIYEAELHRKRQELEADPEGGREELALIYQVKGVPEEDARKLTKHLSRDPEQFLRTLAAEDLNLTEDALSKPLVSAFSGAVSTAIGGFIPLIPFFFLSGYPAVIGAAVISLLAHFAVGAAKTMITVRSWWSSGLEMTLVGAVEGIVTYIIGIGRGHLGT